MRPEDSLDIIAEMMSKTRKSVLQDSYAPFLIWGWATVAVGLTVYLSVTMLGNYNFYMLWFLLPVIGISGVKFHRQHHKNEVKTTLTSSLGSIWRMFTVLLVCFSVYSFFVPFNVLFFILLILSIGCYVTGASIKYPLLQYSSIIGFIVDASLWAVNGPTQIILFLIAIVAMMIIPGYKMKEDLRHDRT